MTLLPFRLVEGCVIGDFNHEIANLGTEDFFEFRSGRLRILNGVVEECGLQCRQVGYATDMSQDLGDSNRVVDVGRLVLAFATLVTVFFSGESDSPQEIYMRVKLVSHFGTLFKFAGIDQ